MAKDFTNHSGIKTLGLKQNNPGNVRPLGRRMMWEGQTGVNKGFAVFKDVGYGIRAIMKNAIVQIQKNGRDTLAKYITAYAPPKENDTAKYIRDACNALGMAANEKIVLTPEFLHKLVRLHLQKEIGTEAKHISDEDIMDGYLKL